MYRCGPGLQVISYVVVGLIVAVSPSESDSNFDNSSSRSEGAGKVKTRQVAGGVHTLPLPHQECFQEKS